MCKMQRKVADVVEQKAKLAISVIAGAKISKFQPLSLTHTSWRHQNISCERTDFMTNVLCYNIIELKSRCIDPQKCCSLPNKPPRGPPISHTLLASVSSSNLKRNSTLWKMVRKVRWYRLLTLTVGVGVGSIGEGGVC